MSGLQMTREQVEDTRNKAGNHLLNTPDDVGAQEYFCYSTDWLAMYDLLVWFKECDEGLPDKGRTVLANQMTDKIRALIGGE